MASCSARLPAKGMSTGPQGKKYRKLFYGSCTVVPEIWGTYNQPRRRRMPRSTSNLCTSRYEYYAKPKHIYERHLRDRTCAKTKARAQQLRITPGSTRRTKSSHYDVCARVGSSSHCSRIQPFLQRRFRWTAYRPSRKEWTRSPNSVGIARAPPTNRACAWNSLHKRINFSR